MTNLESTERLSEESVLERMRLTDLSLRVLRTQINRDGFNVVANLGQVSGARVARHFHVHVMPHRKGNTNFMPLLSHTGTFGRPLSPEQGRLHGRHWLSGAGTGPPASTRTRTRRS